MNTQNSLRAIFGGLTILAVLAFATPTANAQTTLTWIGGHPSSNNVSGTTNWLGGNAPAASTDYHFVFDAANLVTPFRTTATWNVASVGFSSLSLTGNATYPSFSIGGTSSIALKGNVTVTSGNHTLNTTAVVNNDATWSIAADSSLSRGTTDTFTMAAGRTITKTGAGTLTLTSSNTGIAGTIEVQQGVLRVSTNDNALGNATVALNGGTFEIFSNGARTNANAATTVIGESTVRLARDSTGAGVSHVMGTLQLGSSKLTVTANAQNTSGTANVTYGATTLSNNAALEVVNNGVGATTRVTLGAVGESGGSRGLTKTGSGELSLTGVNTYTGTTTVSAGTLLLEDNAELRFLIGSNGVNNALLGSGTATLNGDFRFDLTGAGTTIGNTWNIVDVASLTETFGGTFQVFSTLGSFTNNAGVWSITENSVTYEFSQSLGTLTVIPEPSTWALLAGSLTALMIFRRRRGTC